MYCIRHIADNFLRRFKVPYLHKLVICMGSLHFVCTCELTNLLIQFSENNISIILCFVGYSRTEREFNIHYERMWECGEVYTDWFNEIPREKWVQAYDSRHR